MSHPTSRIQIALALVGLIAVPASAQVVLPTQNALPISSANTAQPGFIWNVFQNEADQRTTLVKTEEALAGLLRDVDNNPLPNNAADYEIGGADATGVKLGTADNSLLQFTVSRIINFNQDLASIGNIPDDEGIPGVPGLTGSTDGVAGEVLTWLSIPVGTHTLIVNSDDGFRLIMGGASPKDSLGTFVGEFDAGRGASDTIMQIQVTQAGLYATRLIWQEGGGGANLEFVQVLPDNTRVAVNSEQSTIKAFRSVTGTAPTFVRSAVPASGSTSAAFDTPITVELSGAAVTPASVQLSLDGAPVNATVTKVGDITTVQYQPPGRFASGSQHSISVAFNDGQDRTVGWNFTVAEYAVLTADLKATPDTSKPGFTWSVHQNAAFQANDNIRPIQQLSGLLGVNFADPDAIGAATARGVPGATDRLPIFFEIAGVINLNQDVFAQHGEFLPDEQMPGIPGLGDTGQTDGIAAEILTYIELPAGIHTLIVNSDDGFRTTAGNVKDIFRAQLAGQFVGGRGAADTTYRVVVEEAGVYPFRTIWYEGGSDANIEWKQVKPDQTRVLINDTANGGFPAYRAKTSGNLTAVTRVSPAQGDPQTLPTANVEVIIEEGTTTVDTATVRLSIDGTQVTPTVTKAGNIVTVFYNPPTDFTSSAVHTASITFTAGTERTESWSFTVPPLTRDVIDGKVGFVIAGANWTADGAGRTGLPGDHGMNFPVAPEGVVNVVDGTFLNAAAADDTMTVAFWQKSHAVRNSSAFWALSPSSPSSSRGFQAHVPWGDSTIYFDSTGCCNADETRINLGIAQYPEYSGAPTWWQEWHHFAFVKRGGEKEIWINGDLFHSGFGIELPSDFTSLVIGGGPGITENRMAGILDDFTVFSSALTPEQIGALASGTAPGAVTGNPGLVAHWDFNDPPTAVGPAPTVSVARSGDNIIVTWTGTLESATTLAGPFSPVAGVTSPATIPASAAQQYYRARD